ncbi:hypothetical protein AVEN_231667-1 [Araneus ventricosus]|uniref:Uncharacterized protein n=1 Tax=Araneus ventricosus TaxID=182803 RepID=A0A4Y2RTW4_ARAVE|nr:hypothetical protein AVEN_231667-1 [Araneus ventricosus]
MNDCHFSTRSLKYQESSRVYYLTSLPLGKGIKASFQKKSESVELRSAEEAANKIFLDIRKDVKDAYNSRSNIDVIDIGVSYDGIWLARRLT